MAELVDAVERTSAGELLCSPRIAAQLLRQAAHRSRRSVGARHRLHPHRTPAAGVIAPEARTLSNKEIANELTIAEATVKNHVHHVLEKLHVTTRGKAAAAGLPSLKATFSNRSSRRAG